MAKVREGMVEAKLDEVALKALDALADIFDHPAKQRDPDAQRLGRISSSIVQAWTRMRATESQQETLRVMIAKGLTDDKSGEFRRYLLEAGRAPQKGR